MSNESPLVPPDKGEEELVVHNLPGTGNGDTDRVENNIRRIAEVRLGNGAHPDKLQRDLNHLKAELAGLVAQEKELRLEKVRLVPERDALRERVINLKRERMKKDSQLASIRSKINEVREASGSEGNGEIERLERRIRELNDDIDAFRETLSMHRRDRFRVLDLLIEAQSRLQDKLTESTLWQLLDLENEVSDDEGRKGKSGLTAELLGRLLLLEKEEAQICSYLNRNRNRPNIGK